MITQPKIEDRTRILARVVGPYITIAALSAGVRGASMRSLMETFSSNALWPWVTGAFLLPMGMLVVVLHPYWNGIAAAVISALGWLTAFKGLALMAFPVPYLAWGNGLAQSAPWWQVTWILVAVMGLYLTMVGWMPRRGARGSSRSASAHSGLPRAA